MKILCTYSGIEFSCDHFPYSLHSRESFHPIFSIPQKKLLGMIGKWASQELTETDSYLLFLSILKSTDLVEFRVPPQRTIFTSSIIAQNMEALVKAVIKLNTVSHPAIIFPSYVISPETKTLSNIKYWIQNWEDAYQEFLDGYRTQEINHKLLNREEALEKLIKNPYKEVKEYARQIAEWASTAGQFPQWKTVDSFTKKQCTCDEYWKTIIYRCSREESIFSVPEVDLGDLLEHCELNIDAGSIFANTLFTILRKAVERQRNFLGFGSFSIGSSPLNSFSILEESTGVEAANIQAIIQSAPEEKPAQEQYPTKFAFMRAKAAWELALKNGMRSA